MIADTRFGGKPTSAPEENRKDPERSRIQCEQTFSSSNALIRGRIMRQTWAYFCASNPERSRESESAPLGANRHKFPVLSTTKAMSDGAAAEMDKKRRARSWKDISGGYCARLRSACGRSCMKGLRPDQTDSASDKPCSAILPATRPRDGNSLRSPAARESVRA